MSPKMGLDSLKGNLTNPQRTYNWEVKLLDVVGGGNTEMLLLRAQSTSLPGKSFGQIKIPYKQTSGFVVPGKLNFGQTWSCTFIEGEDKKVFDALHAWNQAIVNDTTGISIGDEQVKRDLYLTMISTKGEDTLVMKLIGCFPQNVSDVSLSYDNEDAVKFEVTWSYDLWQEA